MNTIHSFDGPNRFLSNFWLAPVTHGGIRFPTVEHAYQAAKFDSLDVRKAIANAPTPGKAKTMSRKFEVSKSWNQNKKVIVMEDLLRQKFEHAHLRDQLLATGFVELEEGNTWGDRFWGICPPQSGNGENTLGKLLMKIRADLRMKQFNEI